MGTASTSLTDTRELVGRSGAPGGQGPFFSVHLRVNGQVVEESYFYTVSCPHAELCGNSLARLVLGRTLRDASGLTLQDFRRHVGTLRRDKRHFVNLAYAALQQALGQV